MKLVRTLLLGLAVAGCLFLFDSPVLAQIDPPDPNGACDPNGIDPVACPDGDACTVGRCNPATRRCELVPVVCDQDGNLCTEETCNPESGECESGPPRDCSEGGEGAIDDGEGGCSGEQVCNPSTGECEGGPVDCAPDDNLCTVESCSEVTGRCESGPPIECEQDEDICTREECNPSTGTCRSVPANPSPEGCEGAICRTAGFWGTHAGTDKGAKNITLAVITAAGGSLSICGETITNTTVNDDASALEGLCVSVKGTQRLQLARQLTAAALNCVISDEDGDCSSTPLFASVFAECNAICANAASSTSSVADCIAEVDCLNNGGVLLANGFCQTGTCASDHETPCKVGTSCEGDAACIPLDGNCHSELLVNEDLDLSFLKTGPAGSSKACNQANKNSCVIVGSAQSNCLL